MKINSDRTSPVEKTPISFPSESLTQSRGMLQLSWWDHLELYRLASPFAPEFYGNKTDFPAHWVSQSASSGNINYSARWHSLWITEIASQPTVLGTHSITSGVGGGRGLAKYGDTIFMGTGTGIASINVNNPLAPYLIQRVDSAGAVGLALNNNYLYNLSPWGAQIEVWNIVNPEAMNWVAHYTIPPSPSYDNYRIACNAAFLIAVTNGQLICFAIQNDGTLVEHATITPSSGQKASSAALLGKVLYSATDSGNLLIYPK